MKVAFTYNLRLTDVRESEKEAEYDSADTVNAIAAAIEAAGHEVEKVEVSGPASNLLERLEAIDPDIVTRCVRPWRSAYAGTLGNTDLSHRAMRQGRGRPKGHRDDQEGSRRGCRHD